MSLQEFMQSIVDRLHATGNVKTVFGEPIDAKGRIIIPVAKVVYGFGGGAGGSRKSDSEDGGVGLVVRASEFEPLILCVVYLVRATEIEPSVATVGAFEMLA